MALKDRVNPAWTNVGLGVTVILWSVGGGGGVEVTVTEAIPRMLPLAANTLKVPVEAPAVKTELEPEAGLIRLDPLTDQPTTRALELPSE
jgi:hypothetical protein